jgi:general secretion pathway protein A
MYCKFFALKQWPFPKDLDPDQLFKCPSVTEFEARLRHLVEMRGIGLFTGEPGCGKTTVCRKVASSLHTGLFKTFYVCNSSGGVMDLYKLIAWQLGLPVERSRAALYRSISAEVTRLCTETRISPVLFIDEAHLLLSELLEELRMLTNYEMDSKNRLCIALVGQPELRRRINMAVHEALNQRIVVRHQMGIISLEETGLYLEHQLRLAGTEMPIFEKAAVTAIHQATSGLLRRINALAHHALIAAAGVSCRTVSAELVESALGEVS